MKDETENSRLEMDVTNGQFPISFDERNLYKHETHSFETTQPTHDSATAAILRCEFSVYTWCLRCGYPWNYVKPHETWYQDNRACFPLCENCWTTLACPEARIEYYKAVVDAWDQESPGSITDDEKRNIQKAVANGG